ncbi:hypothetical protein MANES_09G038250v8 [Manihot esculenta]|uniref:Uncharacterized protein n=1 Tax=Manihot esculenta TaxID=3983 RepID=A0ACB7H3U4_MANES|nr:hypothetical protein MANES_09G038250v8 [Manihot esculenta]
MLLPVTLALGAAIVSILRLSFLFDGVTLLVKFGISFHFCAGFPFTSSSLPSPLAIDSSNSLVLYSNL